MDFGGPLKSMITLNSMITRGWMRHAGQRGRRRSDTVIV